MFFIGKSQEGNASFLCQGGCACALLQGSLLLSGRKQDEVRQVDGSNDSDTTINWVQTCWTSSNRNFHGETDDEADFSGFKQFYHLNFLYRFDKP